MAIPDLITEAQLEAYLADYGLSSGETALLPDLAAAASNAVRRYCNRVFTETTYDQIYTSWPPSNVIVLDQLPVTAIERVACCPTTAVTIGNASGNSYRATVTLTSSGDVAVGLTPTGITLTRYAAGSSYATTLAFGSATSIYSVGDLAAAVNALGSGWSATAMAGAAAGWAVADIRPVQGPLPALGQNAAELTVFGTDLVFAADEVRGILTLGQPSSYADDSPRWGPTQQIMDVTVYGGRGGLRVKYTAGYGSASMPADVVQYTAETVKATLDRLRTDSALKSESDGVLSWSARPVDELTAVPPAAMAGLAPWVNRRA